MKLRLAGQFVNVVAVAVFVVSLVNVQGAVRAFELVLVVKQAYNNAAMSQIG